MHTVRAEEEVALVGLHEQAEVQSGVILALPVDARDHFAVKACRTAAKGSPREAGAFRITGARLEHRRPAGKEAEAQRMIALRATFAIRRVMRGST